MNDKKLRLGLIGKDVSKSTSQEIHTFILREKGYGCEYEKFSVSPENFDGVVRTLLGDFDGFNVTIPYKKDILCYLDGVQGDALACGSVNTVISSLREGYNTDGVGFMLMLDCAGISLQGKKALVLGTGGAGSSSAVALKNAGAEVFAYRRNQEELLETCEKLGVHATQDPESGFYDILVNCTGVGMHESVGRSPVSEKAFMNASLAIDLIYEPAEPEFLRLAKSRGLQVINGKAMLFYQAYYADCLFLGQTPNKTEAKALYEKYQKEKTEVFV